MGWGVGQEILGVEEMWVGTYESVLFIGLQTLSPTLDSRIWYFLMHFDLPAN